MKSQRSVREIKDLVLSRKCLVLLTAAGVLLAALVASAFMPRLYESSTRICVAGSGNEAERLEAIRAEILSLDSIGGAIDKLGLESAAPGAADHGTREELARNLTANTAVELLEGAGGRLTFRVSHLAEDPAVAQRIVAHLTTGNQAERSEAELRAAEAAVARIKDEVGGLEAGYARSVDDIAEFEEKHAQHRFGQADNTDAQYEKELDLLHDAEVRLSALELQLGSVREQLAEEPEWLEVEEKVGNQVAIDRIRADLRSAEDDLAQMRQSHTDAHPKVIANAERVERLRARLAEEQAGIRTVTRKVQNQTHVELKRSEIEALSALTVARRLRSDYLERVDALESRRAEFPDLLKQWEALKSVRAEARAQFDAAREREGLARSALDRTAAEAAPVFDVVEAPTLPARPASPERGAILVAGLILGLAIGVAGVLVLDRLDPSLRSADEAASALGLPVLGAIARIETLSERDTARRRGRLALLAAAAVLILVGIAAAARLDEKIGWTRGSARDFEAYGERGF